MRTIAIALLLLCTGITACSAGTDPSVKVQINTVGNYKDYIYTLTNDAGSNIDIVTFTIYMPESAARSVTNFTTTKAGWHQDASFRGDNSLWAMFTLKRYELTAGDSATFTLRTPASMSTSYTYRPELSQYNWRWNGTYAGSFLPVPVPEPSSILALFGGIAGLGGFALRRKMQ